MRTNCAQQSREENTLITYDDWLERPPQRRMDQEELDSLLDAKFEEGYSQAIFLAEKAIKEAMRLTDQTHLFAPIIRALNLDPETFDDVE